MKGADSLCPSLLLGLDSAILVYNIFVATHLSQGGV